ncbi:chemotaxis protein CheW [Paraburkholderia sp.]|uniref:chemotaxis protein CheW n=1 Tax=Paraburkholderia sp. TaxID=1926495 RepID=UPI0034195EBE
MLFVLFTLDTDRYVIDASQVERMLPLARDTPPKSIPGAPSWVAGVIDHEGTPLPVIDLPALTLGRPAPPPSCPPGWCWCSIRPLAAPATISACSP